jgi:hypothetical protein
MWESPKNYTEAKMDKLPELRVFMLCSGCTVDVDGELE